MAVTLWAGSAHADKPLWEIGLGAGWLHLPHYRGSDQSRDWLLPIPYFVYRGEIFRADREGARAFLIEQKQGFGLDLSAAVSTPTRSSRSYNRCLYDVAPAQARPGRPAYQAEAGRAGWVGAFSASRRLGAFWIGTYAQADSVRGAVFEPSPLVRQRTNISYGVGMSWVFKESSARARGGS